MEKQINLNYYSIIGLYWGYVGILEMEMEITILGYIGFRDRLTSGLDGGIWGYGHMPKRLACNRALGPHPLHTPLHRVCSRGRFSRHTQSFLSCGRHEGCATRGM